MIAQTASEVEKWFERHEEWRKYADLVLMPPEAVEVVEEFPEVDGSELLRDEYAMSTFGVTRLALYTKLRREGQSHRFSEMVATQRPPRCMTDDVFFAGLPRLADQMTPGQLKYYVAQARKHGHEPSADSVYHSGLARFPGDPQAFVTRSMGRGYIKKLCEERGWACHGAVESKGRQTESDPLADENCTPLADDIVNYRVREMVSKNPELKKRSRKELRREVLRKHGPSSGKA